MSESQHLDEALSPGQPEATDTNNVTRTAGAMLRSARQAQGLHIVHLSAMLKVSPARLEALEADRFEGMPDMVYARALLGSACRCLKVDPEPMLALLPAALARPLQADSEHLNQSFQDTPGTGKLFAGSWRGKPLGWLLLIILVAIFLVVFWPSRQEAEDSPGEPATSQTPAPATSPQDPPRNLPVPEKAAAVSTAPQVAPAADAMPGAGGAGSAMPGAGAPGVVTAPTTAGAEAKPDDQAVLSLRFSDDVWLMVTDARGVQQVQRTAKSGEVINISAETPLSVVLGRADKVDVRVRGVVRDVSAWTQGNVARFEVK